ncbi:TonB-dependent receptor [Bacteroidales bacterium AH-315-N07]|nr:TonB-dependent receptor [Bacteroidales bacterium AH-315-N07]
MVEGEKIIISPSYKAFEIDSQSLYESKFESLAEVLTNHSPIFIKTYGQGSLATASFRGTNSTHTQINWNGINLNSPTLGMLDLSLIPVSLADNIAIVYGGGSLLQSNGGIGGSVQLKNNPDWNNKFKVGINQQIGSFNSYSTHINFKYGSKKWLANTKLFRNTSANDFPYKNITKNESPVERQTNAETKQHQILQEIYYKIDSNNTLAARVWYLNSNRNIPPTLLTPSSAANLDYEAMRSMLEWKKKFINKGSLILRTSYLNELSTYVDTISAINSTIKTHSLKNQLRLKLPVRNNIILQTGADGDIDFAKSEGYEDPKLEQRNTIALFFNVDIHTFNRLKLNIHLRQVLIDKDLSPFLIAIGLEYQIFANLPARRANTQSTQAGKTLSFKTNISRNFKAPGLNDLYWYPGGNPNLKPEKGWSSEAGLFYKKTNRAGTFKVESDITGFYSRIEDWILWSPSGKGYWQAQNLREVLSRGIESSLKSTVLFLKGFRIEAKGMYSYVRSTNEKSISNDDASIGKQLIYVPIHNFQSYIRIIRSGFYFTLQHTYSSIRYMTTDNLWYLPDYDLTNLIAGKKLNLKEYSLNLQFEIKNINNIQYQAMSNRPIPGRFYNVSVSFLFNQGTND